MIVVISPAKRLDFETAPSIKTHTTPVFLDEAEQLVGRLKKMKASDFSGLMNVSEKIAQLNHSRYRAWRKPFTPANAKQAVMAFKGDVYIGLDVDSFTPADFKFAQKHLRVLSGLYGLLKPLDLIQPYRLEMGTRLDTERGADLYEFWDSRIAEKINDECRRDTSGVVVNLASNEYFKSIAGRLEARVVTPVFKERRNGAYKVISFSAKKARGMMSRFIIRNRIRDVNAVKKFRQDKYRYSAKLSAGDTWVFARG